MTSKDTQRNTKKNFSLKIPFVSLCVTSRLKLGLKKLDIEPLGTAFGNILNGKVKSTILCC